MATNKKIIAEYIWLGGKNEVRSKARTLDAQLWTPEDLPIWNYDGSSTGQAEGHDSEVLLHPGAVFPDPIRGGKNILVICDARRPDGTPVENNRRVWAKKIFDKAPEEKPWFGLEQEYFLIDPKTGKPLGFPQGDGNPNPQGQYYCSAGTGNAFGRGIVEEHYRACLDAGLKISGINAEVAPGQWEFQIGPAEGIEAGDHMWVARYLLERITEKYGLKVSLHPKPLIGDWNGSGCHCNFSTEDMRNGTEDKTGLEIIDEAIYRLSLKHKEHIAVYGEDNHMRLTGKHETSSMEKFTFGRANRGASVRIPNSTIQDGKGYFEDRRPSSNCDPYVVSAILFKTCVLDV